MRGTLLLVLVFAAGLSAGVLYERRQNHGHERVAADTHSFPQRLASELQLSPAQQDAINRILARHQQDVESTWHEMQPRVHAALDATEQEIVGVLTPEQAAKFRELTRTHHPPGQRR